MRVNPSKTQKLRYLKRHVRAWALGVSSAQKYVFLYLLFVLCSISANTALAEKYLVSVVPAENATGYKLYTEGVDGKTLLVTDQFVPGDDGKWSVELDNPGFNNWLRASSVNDSGNGIIEGPLSPRYFVPSAPKISITIVITQ